MFNTLSTFASNVPSCQANQLVQAQFSTLDFPNDIMFPNAMCKQMHPNDPGQQSGLDGYLLLANILNASVDVTAINADVTWPGDQFLGCEAHRSPGFSPEVANLCQAPVLMASATDQAPPGKSLITLTPYERVIYKHAVCLKSRDVAFNFLLPWIKSGGYVNRRFFGYLNTTSCPSSANTLYPYSLDGSQPFPLHFNLNGTMTVGIGAFRNMVVPVLIENLPGFCSLTGPGCSF